MWNIIVRDGQGNEVARAEVKEGALTLGREKDRGLVLPSGAVSRKHARFELRGDKLFFFDEGSANGSIVDGRRVVAPVEVSARSAIEITPFRIAVEGGDEDEEEKTVMLKRPPAGAPPPPPRAVPPSPPPRAAPPAPPRPAPPPAAPTLSDLRPVMPAAAAPRPAPAPSDTAFTVRFPDATPASRPGSTPAPPKTQNEWDAAAAELDKHIQGIRAYREQTTTNTNIQQVLLDQGWAQLIGALQNVQKRLAGNPRVQTFAFSRDGKEVIIKLQDSREKRGFRYFTVSRNHPAGKFQGLNVVWLCETGRDDVNFRDPKDAMTDIFQRIASTLA